PAKVAAPLGRYLVLVDPGAKDEFLPAAEALAALHGAELKRFDPARLDATLELATRVDDDPFVDFEYGFVTGRDGAAAVRFVRRIEQAWRRDFGDRATLFASWEGAHLPSGEQMTGLKALGFSAQQRLVKASDAEEVRAPAARRSLRDCQGNDALIFMSHGYPDRMESCFRAKDLRD